MGAYNYEQYVGRALESALAQDYPADRMEIIVVNDGSTDGTAAVVAELAARHPGRIRLIDQENGGYIAATNRAMAEAQGELLALLDADDIWLAHKTRRQVELLRARPGLGLVFSDMTIVDENEFVVTPSLIGPLGDLPAQAFARVLTANVATQSSIMIRASLRELFDPIPAGIPYADWWLTLRAAQVAQIDYIREPLALYRQHGANLTGGVSGTAGVREHRKEVAFALWCLRHLPLDAVAAHDISMVWGGVEEHARRAMQAGGSFFVQLACAPTAQERNEAAHSLELARDRELAGDLDGEARLRLRALAWDPFAVGARQDLDHSVDRARAAAARPHPVAGARSFVVATDAEMLLASDEMMLAYAEALAGSELITLAIDSTRLAPEVAERELNALVSRCGLADRDDIDLLAVVGDIGAAQRYRFQTSVHARYAAHDTPQAEDGPPVFGPARLAELRAYAQAACLLGPETARQLLASAPA
jgi:hypothetical protein